MNTIKPTANKRICIVLSALTRGGVVFVYSRLAKELKSHGWEVTIVSLMARDECAYLFDGFEIVYLGAPRPLAWLALARFFCKHNDFSVILSAVDYVNITTAIAKWLSGIRARFIATVHSNVAIELRHTPSTMHRLVMKLAPFFYRYPSHFVAVSAGVKESIIQLSHVPPEKISVIYNPIDEKHFVSAQDMPPPHAFFSEKNRVVLGCGRLTPAKDFSLLLSAFALAATRSERLRLILVGDGEQRAALEAQAKSLGMTDKIHFTGVVDNVESYMAHADLLVLSSAWEGFGNVIVEALAAGCPVVSMDCPSGPREILEDGKWGKLVETRTPEALAQAILEALDAPKPAAGTLQQRARAFSPDKIAAAYLQLMG